MRRRTKRLQNAMNEDDFLQCFSEAPQHCTRRGKVKAESENGETFETFSSEKVYRRKNGNY